MKSYTDLEQSKKLAEFLSIESADTCFNTHNNMPPLMTPYKRFKEFFDMEPTPAFLIPCWSLAVLMDVLERGALFKTSQGWTCQFYTDLKVITIDYHSNPVDACYEMIIKLHEQNLL